MIDAAGLHATRYDAAADLVVRSPGRINLIGEHTDYCGLPVLPMAIGEAVFVAASVADRPGLHAYSTLDDATIEQEPRWAKYVHAAWDQLAGQAGDRSARLAIDSDLPATGGLSSSSALTVGVLVALNELWSLQLSPDKIIEHALAAERSVAIAGGAMDQTVITLARPGHALRIDFDPPSHRHIPMPPGFGWVAGYSGEEAPKGYSAADSYNSFVLASRAAAVQLGSGDPADPATPPLLSRVANAALPDVDALPKLTVTQAAALIGGEDFGLDSDRQVDLAVAARHVLTEAARVDQAEGALRAGNMAQLGALMDESHASLQRYGASTAQLDRLVAAARESGAVGARLTGAGFGGWAIALAPLDEVPAVMAAMTAACGGPSFAATAEGGALWSLRTG